MHPNINCTFFFKNRNSLPRIDVRTPQTCEMWKCLFYPSNYMYIVYIVIVLSKR